MPFLNKQKRSNIEILISSVIVAIIKTKDHVSDHATNITFDFLDAVTCNCGKLKLIGVILNYKSFAL